MTNEQAIAHAVEKFKTIRRNKDGSINGNAVHGLEMGMRRRFEKNGMTYNEAYYAALPIIRGLKNANT